MICSVSDMSFMWTCGWNATQPLRTLCVRIWNNCLFSTTESGGHRPLATVRCWFCELYPGNVTNDCDAIYQTVQTPVFINITTVRISILAASILGMRLVVCAVHHWFSYHIQIDGVLCCLDFLPFFILHSCWFIWIYLFDTISAHLKINVQPVKFSFVEWTQYIPIKKASKLNVFQIWNHSTACMSLWFDLEMFVVAGWRTGNSVSLSALVQAHNEEMTWK